MIAKYLFFLILFMVILIHALEPWSRLSAAALFMSRRDQSTQLCVFLHAPVGGFARDCANATVKMKAPRV